MAEWCSMIEQYGFLNAFAIGEQSIHTCGFDSNNVDTTCPCFDRIQYILKYYDKWCDKMNENCEYESIHQYINEQLICYHRIALLNDYNHILRYHKSNDTHLEFMVNKLGKCNISICNKMKRNQQKNRGRKLNYSANICSDLYFGITDPVEVSCIDTLDRIHCSLYHSFDLFRLTTSQRETLQTLHNNSTRTITSETMSKINTFTAKSVNNLKMFQDNNDNNDVFNKFVDSYPLHTQITQDNEQKYSDEFDEECDDIFNEECKNISMYDFGHEYNYAQLQPYHKDVKDEMLHNNLCEIDIFEWESTIEKAYELVRCQAARNLFHEVHLKGRNWQHYYENDEDEPFLSTQLMKKIRSAQRYNSMQYVNNILSILLYCNFSKLQQRLSETYRIIDENDCVEMMMKRHEQFVNWAKLIHETVSLFGYTMQKSDEFYRGVKGNFMISNTNASIFSPTSTSANDLIAHTFAGIRGYILCFTKDANVYSMNTPKCIDCTWISDYGYEDERLFAGKIGLNCPQLIGNSITISSIIDCTTGSNKRKEMHSLGIFTQTVTVQHYDNSPLMRMKKTMKDEYIKNINKVWNKSLPHFIGNVYDSFELYFLNNICKSLKTIRLSKQIQEFYPKMFIKHQMIDWSIINSLFSNAKSCFMYGYPVTNKLFGLMARSINKVKNSSINHIEFIAKNRIELKCICGQELRAEYARNVYDGKGVKCIKCKQISVGFDIFWHCDKGKGSDKFVHPNGYDICYVCRKKAYYKLISFKQWKKVFKELNWLLLSNHEYAYMYQQTKRSLEIHEEFMDIQWINATRIILFNLNSANIHVECENVVLTKPQVYMIHIQFEDELFVISKRYAQYHGLKKKLQELNIIPKNAAFPKKKMNFQFFGGILFVPNVQQRAIELNDFMMYAITKCKEIGKLEIIYEFLFELKSLRNEISWLNHDYYTYEPRSSWKIL
eukprot:87843_1